MTESTYLDQIIEKALARRHKWIHEELDTLPKLCDITESCIIGGYSLIMLETQRRLILKPQCIEIAPGLFETPPSIARDYLTLKYQHSPKLTHKQYLEIKHGLRSMPLFAIPTHFSYGYYIDLKAAYWTLMLRAGWDLDYWPGEWLAKGRPPLDFPFPQHKIARNCLVSSGLTSDLSIWTHKDGLKNFRKGNPLANLQLFRFISDVLNSIADEIRNVGAVYVNTDGYILPDEQRMIKAVKVIAEWGLEARIKGEGPGRVRGPGDYKVGDMESRRGLKQNIAIHNIYDPDCHQWLKKKMQWLGRVGVNNTP